MQGIGNRLIVPPSKNHKIPENIRCFKTRV